MSHAIVVNDLGFAWPDGEVLFDQLSFVVGAGRTGLIGANAYGDRTVLRSIDLELTEHRIAVIGANGSGKSTLLRLVAGELTPARGSVQVVGGLGYLRQDLTLDASLPVEEVLGIARARRGLRAIERGKTAEEHFAAVGDHWDVDERAHATLDRLGLGHVGLERRVGKAGGTDILLYRREGRIFALANRCSHRGGPLHKGRVADGTVRCPWHLSTFSLEDGSILQGPATAPQPCYQTRVRDGAIEVREPR